MAQIELKESSASKKTYIPRGGGKVNEWILSGLILITGCVDDVGWNWQAANDNKTAALARQWRPQGTRNMEIRLPTRWW